ncbi:hypothetical protein [Thalassotalea litorea]|nr:hypothetical protein [Thalassotalea litorea]
MNHLRFVVMTLNVIRAMTHHSDSPIAKPLLGITNKKAAEKNQPLSLT